MKLCCGRSIEKQRFLVPSWKENWGYLGVICPLLPSSLPARGAMGLIGETEEQVFCHLTLTQGRPRQAVSSGPGKDVSLGLPSPASAQEWWVLGTGTCSYRFRWASFCCANLSICQSGWGLQFRSRKEGPSAVLPLVNLISDFMSYLNHCVYL